MICRTLQHQAILNLNDLNLLLAAYGPFYHIFHKNNQICIDKIDVGHKAKIITACYDQTQSLVYSLDENGLFVEFQLDMEGAVVKAKKEQIKSLKNKIKSAKIMMNNNQVLVLYIEEETLHKCNIKTKECTKIPHQPSHQIVYSSYPHLITINQSSLSVINVFNNQLIKKYQHSVQICSAALSDNDLILGDAKGKIYILHSYLQNQNKVTKTKLEWHVNKVNCIEVMGQYMYSGGEESVVVMWHLSQIHRDFLPRIGTSIESIKIDQQSNEIICGMGDGSIRCILLNNDKELKTYRTIIDPWGYAKNSEKRFSICNYYSGYLCLNSVPGRLQFINTKNNGTSNEFQIINRNLTCGLDLQEPQPHQLSFVCFSPQWNYLAVVVEANSNQYKMRNIKFYKKTIENQFQLVSKVQNIHCGQISGCLNVTYENEGEGFMTYSREDEKVKFWNKIKKTKQSLLSVEEVFWNCAYQFQHKGLKPVHIDALEQNIVICYPNEIVLLSAFNLEQRINIQSSSAFFIQENVLLVSLQAGVQMWDLKNNRIPITFDGHKVVEVSRGSKFTSILTTYKKGNKLIVLNNKNLVIEGCYDFEEKLIEKMITRDDNIILVMRNMMLGCLSIKEKKWIQLIKYNRRQEKNEIEKEEQKMEMQEETLFDIYERHVRRQESKKGRGMEKYVGLGSATMSAKMALRQMLL